MSLNTIKSTLDQYLYANITDVVIKNENSLVYTLNSVPLTSDQLNNLQYFILPKIVPITQDDELISGGETVNTRAFYQVEIFVKKGVGTGDALTMEDRLNTLYRNQLIGNVTCENTSVLSPFEDGEWYVTVHRISVREWS